MNDDCNFTGKSEADILLSYTTNKGHRTRQVVETRKYIFQDKTVGIDHTWSICRLMEFIRLPVITRMLTSKKGALLKEIIDLDHNYTLTSDSE